jgi:hypothetical protein
VNAAAQVDWLPLPLGVAVRHILEATERHDARIAALPDEAVRLALTAYQLYILDRSPHRAEHTTQIRRACGL